MSKRDIHIVPAGKGWAVKETGADVPISNHRTQSGALRAGKKLARRNDCELIVHRADGRVRGDQGIDSEPPAIA